MHHVVGLPRLLALALVLWIFAAAVGWLERDNPGRDERWKMRGLFIVFALLAILPVIGYNRLW
jgi:hypothetical protein